MTKTNKNHNFRRAAYSAASLATLALLVNSTAAAQEEPQEDTKRLGTVVVTAQKKSENLQSVPIAVSAFSGEAIEAAGVVNVDDIAALTPGFAVSTYNPVSPQPYIRGVGTNSSSVGDDSSVGVFIDEVYAGRAGGFRADMFDIERVEVLRGPQGTLYGRNVAGGAINVVTGNPTDEFEGRVKVGIGRFNLVQTQAMLSGPLAEGIQGRVALSYRDRDGFVTNTRTGNDLRDERNVSARGKLAFQPSANFDILLSGEYSEDKLIGPAARHVVGFEDVFGVALPTEGDAEAVSAFIDGRTDREMFGVSAKATYDFGSIGFTSITAYREQDYSFNDDLFGDYFAVANAALTNDATEKSTQFTQEFRLNAQDTEKLDWTVGAYFFQEDIDRVESFDSTRIYDILGLGGMGLSSRPVWDGNNKTTSIALFGEATYSFTDALSLTLGGRYTDDEKDYQNTASGGPDLFGFLTEAGYDVEDSASFDKFTPKATLQYTFADSSIAYITYSEGFKAGGFNGIASTAQAATVAFEPETAKNYEIGAKTQILNDRLRLNAAAFMLDYTDLQNFTVDLDTGEVVTANGDAEVKGFELEAIALITDGLEANLSYGYLDSEFTRFASNEAIVGNSLARAPEHAFAAALSYSRDLTQNVTMNLRTDYTYQSDIFFSVANDIMAGDEARGLLNASVSFDFTDGISATIWGKNLTDEVYNAHAFSQSGVGFAILGDPATYGASVSYDF